MEYLDLDFISDYKHSFLLPTLGPCFIDFYTEPYCCRTKKSYFIESENSNKIQLSNFNLESNLNDKSSVNQYTSVDTEQLIATCSREKYSGGGNLQC